MKNDFDREYYEDGLVTGKSGYVNYRWMPELTIKMAYNIIKHLNLKDGESVLDFGCAKGFVVKSLKILDINAYGCDISSYAIDNLETEVRNCCKLINSESKSVIPFEKKFDWIMSKDVLEHISEEGLDIFLEESFGKTDKMFHIIPLADKKGSYIVPDYEFDKTHILRKDLNWWIQKFKSKGWNNVSFEYKIKGIKENWTNKYAFGNAFFIVKK
ncbi:MAG: methyltransferase domain-containing protein [Candidatus Magasanikbacteria bacterium]|nr:methyltransferase domain-containing protein [Candidatus Magasanikbacteria bacterium]